MSILRGWVEAARADLSLSLVGSVLAIFATLSAAPATAQPSDSANVQITISVDSIANIILPQGTNFLITVPHPASPQGATIRPVRIPFTVRGNARASVSVAPDVFIQLAHGPFGGRALGPDGGSDALGYDIVVQFPVSSPDYSGVPGHAGFGTWPEPAGLANLPGTDGDGTPPLSVNLSEHDFEAYGTIHIVARRFWTEDGSDAAAGDYAGAVEVTVVAHDE